MNKNEQCLIKYLASGGNKPQAISLLQFLKNHNVTISFKSFNPVCNIIEELEFSENFKYN